MSRKKVLWLTTTGMNIEPVMGSLESVGSFDLEVEHYRFDQVSESQFFDEDLLIQVARIAPDCVFYIGSLEGPYLPRPHVFQRIKEIVPIVHIVFDGGCPRGWATLKRFREEQCFSSTVNIDGNHDWPKGENDITLLCPIDPRPYQKSMSKSIPFGFYGGATSEDRIEILGALKKHELITTAERDERLGSYQPYADFMLKCRMVLNMAKTGSGKTMHVKARVTEAGLAKACLFEQRDSPTKNWLKPMVEYVEYSNTEHLISLVKDFLRAPELASKIGEALHLRITTDYSPEKFYRKIFQRIGLEVS